MALYVSSDVPIEACSWSEKRPGFNVQPLGGSEEGVRSQFSKPHIMYLGAHTGCSCGFAYGLNQPTSEDDLQEEDRGRQSVAALRDFLRDILRSDPEVELFACWEGDQATTPEVRLRVTPEHFAGDAFELPERAFFRVRAAAEQGDAADKALR